MSVAVSLRPAVCRGKHGSSPAFFTTSVVAFDSRILPRSGGVSHYGVSINVPNTMHRYCHELFLFVDKLIYYTIKTWNGIRSVLRDSRCSKNLFHYFNRSCTVVKSLLFLRTHMVPFSVLRFSCSVYILYKYIDI